MTQLPLGVLKNMTAGTTLTTVVTSLPKMSQGRMWLILIWNQLLGIVSFVQTLRKWPLELHERGSGRKSEHFAALLGAAQLKQMKDSHQAIWESNHEIIWTEQEITLGEDHTSFKVNKMTDRTHQLV